MRVLITGASGFIGKNLVARLRELKSVEVSTFDRVGGLNQLSDLVRDSDSVIHLGGVNRTNVPDEFYEGNAGLTSLLCEAVAASGKCVPIVYSSSVQVDVDCDYGRSKLSAEEALKVLNKDTGCPIYIYRLPNIFGKWAKPNYNSVVATFCHNIARDLPININNPNAQINLNYLYHLL